MKKIVLSLLLFTMFTCVPVLARNIKVEAMSDFSTVAPLKIWKLKIVESFIAKDGYTIVEGSILEGRIDKVTPPKRLKQNATFVFVPTRFYDISKGQNYPVKNKVEGTYSFLSAIDKGELAKTGVVMVGNKLVDGVFGPGLALVEGAVANKQGNRFKSSAVALYESTPLSYYNTGKDLEIKQGQRFIMSFKTLEEPGVDKPDYEINGR